MLDESAQYQPTKIRVHPGGGGIRSPHITVDVCTLCGSMVGNKPAHSTMCGYGEGYQEPDPGLIPTGRI